MGFPVTFESSWPSNVDIDHTRYQLDSAYTWSALKNVNTTWIQVCSQNSIKW